MKDFLKRFTSRPFLLTVAAAMGAIGAGITAVTSNDVPVDQKMNAVMAAFVAVGLVVGVYSNAEIKKDSAIAVANIEANSDAKISTVVSKIVKAEITKQVDKALAEK